MEFTQIDEVAEEAAQRKNDARNAFDNLHMAKIQGETNEDVIAELEAKAAEYDGILSQGEIDNFNEAAENAFKRDLEVAIIRARIDGDTDKETDIMSRVDEVDVISSDIKLVKLALAEAVVDEPIENPIEEP